MLLKSSTEAKCLAFCQWPHQGLPTRDQEPDGWRASTVVVLWFEKGNRGAYQYVHLMRMIFHISRAKGVSFLRRLGLKKQKCGYPVKEES